jgi:hypothetical protein
MKNKYFSPALFYDEVRSIIFGATLCNILFLALASYSFLVFPMNILNNSTESISVKMPVGFLYIVIIAVLFTSYNNKDIKYSFMLTQPYSRDAIIITKTVGFMLTYTIPLIIYGIMASSILIQNKLGLGSNYGVAFNLLFTKLFATFVTLTFIVMLMQLMQMLFGKNALAAVIPFGIGVIGFITMGIIYIFASDKLPFIRNIIDFILKTLVGYGYENENGLFILLGKYMKNGDVKISIILAILSILLLFICILLNRRIKTENTSNPYMFKIVEIVTNIIASISIVTLVSLLVVVAVELIHERVTGTTVFNTIALKYGKETGESIVEIGKLVFNIAWIPLSFYMYKLVVYISKKRTVA